MCARARVRASVCVEGGGGACVHAYGACVRACTREGLKLQALVYQLLSWWNLPVSEAWGGGGVCFGEGEVGFLCITLLPPPPPALYCVLVCVCVCACVRVYVCV